MTHHTVHSVRPGGGSARGWAASTRAAGVLLALLVAGRPAPAQQPPGTYPSIPVTEIRPAAGPGATGGLPAQPAPAQPDAKPKPEAAPAPKLLPPYTPGAVRLPRLPGDPASVGGTPRPTPETVADYKKYIKQVVVPETTMELAVGRTHLMVFQNPPRRIQIADETVAGYTLITPMELSMLGKEVGSTVLTLWFDDPADPTKQKVLSYLVRVVPDPEAKERMERVYKALEAEINKAFPDSRVCLSLVGDKLMVCGQAKDIAEANAIVRIVQANAPGGNQRERADLNAARIPVGDPGAVGPDGVPPVGLENYMVAGGLNVVNMLRVPGEQQVMLQVTVAEVNRAAARAIGLNFNIFNSNGGFVMGNYTGAIAPLGGAFNSFTTGIGALAAPGFTGSTGGRSFNNLPVALDNGQIQLAISALRELNYSRTLAEPTLTAINGQTANFQAGGLFPVPYVAGYTNYGLQGVNYLPVGVQLSFTPYITDRDRVRLTVSAAVSARDLTYGSTFINGTAVPNLTTRNFSTVVELREGQTLAVAGLVQNQLATSSSRVPFFGDLPIIGRLASFQRVNADETELVILVTPELVHPMNPKQVPDLPGSDIYEPNDWEFYLLGRLESRRPYDYRSPVMNDLCRMCRYYRCEQTYITGPHGMSGPGGSELPADGIVNPQGQIPNNK
jgi:pilus assembly protein CpaC